MKRKQGKIIPNGVSLDKHENDIVVVFTELGYDVELIPTARRRRMKTADAVIDGAEWEFKTPRNSSTHSLDRIIRKAMAQSNNIVVDLRRLNMPDNIVIKRVKCVIKDITSLRHLKVITKSGNILDLK